MELSNETAQRPKGQKPDAKQESSKAERTAEKSCSEAPFEYMFCHFEPETGVMEYAGCMRLHHKCLVRKVCARSFVVQSAPCTVLNCNHWQVWDGSTDVLVCRCGMGPLQFC